MKSEIASLEEKWEALEFVNPLSWRKIPRLLDLSNNYIQSENPASIKTSRTEIGPEKQSHTNKGKSGKCGSSISLNSVKEKHKLPVK